MNTEYLDDEPLGLVLVYEHVTPNIYSMRDGFVCHFLLSRPEPSHNSPPPPSVVDNKQTPYAAYYTPHSCGSPAAGRITFHSTALIMLLPLRYVGSWSSVPAVVCNRHSIRPPTGPCLLTFLPLFTLFLLYPPLCFANCWIFRKVLEGLPWHHRHCRAIVYYFIESWQLPN